MYNPYSLEGKRILVTGASSGIGQCVAVECSKMGASVIITGRDACRLNDAYAMLEGRGHVQFLADLSDYAGIKQLVDSCSQLDGVSHNAGVSKVLPVKFIQRKYITDVMQVNVYAPVLLTQLLVRNKKINRPASIVFTSALSGIYNVHYGDSLNAASKGALNGFSKGMALDLAGLQMRVNCVNPGILATSANTSLLSGEELKEKECFFPLKRFGQPVDVAFGIIYLLSDASSWVTGANLVIDGGYTLM
jgi:NAD(P)-dependent dehydrogenase (short-subunit alcohol dehydrogenase family)